MKDLTSPNARDQVTRPDATSNARDVAMHSDPRGTGGPEPDEIYGAVSVLYHALKGATTYDKYVGDAQRAGDRELEQFFRACRAEAHARARRALELLSARIADSAAFGDEAHADTLDGD
jgi:hypothetical protein